jgi:hypothetical protein
MQKVRIAEKLDRFKEHWKPKIPANSTVNW